MCVTREQKLSPDLNKSCVYLFFVYRVPYNALFQYKDFFVSDFVISWLYVGSTLPVPVTIYVLIEILRHRKTKQQIGTIKKLYTESLRVLLGKQLE